MAGDELPGPLDLLGRLLMHEVRDRSIETMNLILDGTAMSRRAIELRSAVSDAGVERALVERIVYQSVDYLLVDMLELIDRHRDEMTLVVDGHDVAGESDGLAGELYGDTGWLETFSEFGNPYP